MAHKRFSVIALSLGRRRCWPFGVAYAQNPPAGPPGRGPAMGRWGGQRGPMGPMGMMGMFRRLDLSTQQKDELKATFQAQRDQHQAVMGPASQGRAGPSDRALGGRAGSGQDPAAADDLNQAQQDALSARIAMELKINQILTPAQRQQLRDAQARRASRMGRRGRRGGGSGSTPPGGRT